MMNNTHHIVITFDSLATNGKSKSNRTLVQRPVMGWTHC